MAAMLSQPTMFLLLLPFLEALVLMADANVEKWGLWGGRNN